VTDKEIAFKKETTELMVLDALYSFSETTKRRIRTIDFDCIDGAFVRVTLNLDDEDE
jgi:hypothetical protein